jgi:hypothetical protein
MTDDLTPEEARMQARYEDINAYDQAWVDEVLAAIAGRPSVPYASIMPIRCQYCGLTIELEEGEESIGFCDETCKEEHALEVAIDARRGQPRKRVKPDLTKRFVQPTPTTPTEMRAALAYVQIVSHMPSLKGRVRVEATGRAGLYFEARKLGTGCLIKWGYRATAGTHEREYIERAAQAAYDIIHQLTTGVRVGGRDQEVTN